MGEKAVAYLRQAAFRAMARAANREAVVHLAAAATMYRQMDMGFWLEQAKAEVRELL